MGSFHSWEVGGVPRGTWAGGQSQESSHSPLASPPSTGCRELTPAPQHPDSVQDSLQDSLRTPDPASELTPGSPALGEATPDLALPSPHRPSATHTD